MKLTQLIPMLWVPDVKEAIQFYVDILGFVCSNYVPQVGWGIVRRDGVAIMIALPNAHTPFAGSQFTGAFYFNTDDVDGLWEQLKDKVTIEYPIEDFEYGMREFAIRDNNGYLLEFGQEIIRKS